MRRKIENKNVELSNRKEPLQKCIREWLMVVLTFILAAYAVFLYHLTNRQVKEVSAKADSSFALSKQVAKTQERFAKIDTRAYITYQKVNNLILTVGKRIKAEVVFMNVGKTPANNIKGFTYIKIGTGVYTHEIDSLENKFVDNTVLATAAPGNPWMIMVSLRAMTPIDSIDISTGKKTIYIFGRMIYSDIFLDSDTTRYCVKFIPPDIWQMTTPYNKSE